MMQAKSLIVAMFLFTVIVSEISCKPAIKDLEKARKKLIDAVRKLEERASDKDQTNHQRRDNWEYLNNGYWNNENENNENGNNGYWNNDWTNENGNNGYWNNDWTNENGNNGYWNNDWTNENGNNGYLNNENENNENENNENGINGYWNNENENNENENNGYLNNDNWENFPDNGDNAMNEDSDSDTSMSPNNFGEEFEDENALPQEMQELVYHITEMAYDYLPPKPTGGEGDIFKQLEHRRQVMSHVLWLFDRLMGEIADNMFGLVHAAINTEYPMENAENAGNAWNAGMDGFKRRMEKVMKKSLNRKKKD